MSIARFFTGIVQSILSGLAVQRIGRGLDKVRFERAGLPYRIWDHMARAQELADEGQLGRARAHARKALRQVRALERRDRGHPIVVSGAVRQLRDFLGGLSGAEFSALYLDPRRLPVPVHEVDLLKDPSKSLLGVPAYDRSEVPKALRSGPQRFSSETSEPLITGLDLIQNLNEGEI